MARLARVRALLAVAVIIASTLFVLELPIRELMHQRAEISSTSGELNNLSAENNQLTTTISSLKQNAVVTAIAHADYGLIFPGQQSYIVLPGSTDLAGAANTLGAKPIPASSFVPNDVASLVSGPTAPSQKVASRATGGVFSRTLSRLAFWRWAF